MCHVHSLPGDVMLMSVQLCHLQAKIFIKILLKEQCCSSCKFFCKILNKNWNRRGLNHLIMKIDESDSIT